MRRQVGAQPLRRALHCPEGGVVMIFDQFPLGEFPQSFDKVEVGRGRRQEPELDRGAEDVLRHQFGMEVGGVVEDDDDAGLIGIGPKELVAEPDDHFEVAGRGGGEASQAVLSPLQGAEDGEPLPSGGGGDHLLRPLPHVNLAGNGGMEEVDGVGEHDHSLPRLFRARLQLAQQFPVLLLKKPSVSGDRP